MNVPEAILRLGVVAVLAMYANVHAEPACRIVTERGARRVELSPPMRNAIARYDTRFTVRTDADYLPLIRRFYAYTEFQAPFAVIGHFNGDAVADVVLDGRTGRSSVIIALLSGAGGTYTVSEVARDAGSMKPSDDWYDVGGGQRQFGRWVFLRRRVEAGPVESDFLLKPVVLRRQGFEIEWLEKAAALYYVADDKIIKVIVAD